PGPSSATSPASPSAPRSASSPTATNTGSSVLAPNSPRSQALVPRPSSRPQASYAFITAKILLIGPPFTLSPIPSSSRLLNHSIRPSSNWSRGRNSSAKLTPGNSLPVPLPFQTSSKSYASPAVTHATGSSPPISPR